MAASVAALTQRRFETGPGEQAQFDWGQITVPLGGVRTEIHIFVMALGYSRLGFLRERTPSVAEVIEGGIAASGFVAHTLISRFVARGRWVSSAGSFCAGRVHACLPFASTHG